MAAGGICPLYSICTLFLSSLKHRCASSSDCERVLAFLLSSLEHRCAGSSDCGGGCWLSCCPVLNTAAPVVQTAGECWCICEPMYRGPPRGPCIGFIYPTLLGFGGIQAIILSYKFSYLFGAINCSLIPCRLTKLISNSKGFGIYLGHLAIFLSELVCFCPLDCTYALWNCYCIGGSKKFTRVGGGGRPAGTPLVPPLLQTPRLHHMPHKNTHVHPVHNLETYWRHLQATTKHGHVLPH